jgi:3-phenylpropionate/trans-cinnamate dioxygenase ferredoxin subunit
MGRHIVARADELPPGTRRIVELGGRSIGIFNVGGRLFALRSRCPHMGAALCEGTVTATVTSPCPGEFVFDGESPMLRCPWHGWEFDMATGQSFCDPAKTRVKRYAVGREPGPHVAETFRVERDEDVIVVEV